ncbi:amino acid adenylation domain-containing protein, partial [Pseudoalteromonas sp. XMcav2-N]|uniref:amino acid adenylation domain-containing protein n=1 Tax=Pseudoalteromonas sp. XMcav2-N TaxID=2954498 RepID=UPI002097141D
VPLDPGYPAERLQYMVQDSEACCIVSDDAGQDALGELDITRVAVQKVVQDSSVSDAAVTVSIQPHQLAYVIYTSGSTGQPKGVMVEHQQLSHYVAYAESQYLPGRVGAVVSSSLSFDATVTSLYSPLVCGKAVYLMAEDGLLQRLSEHIKDADRGWMYKLTPAHITAVNSLYEGAEVDAQGQVSHCFVVGGEALSSDAAKTLMSYNASSELFNEYGPTETTVGCTQYLYQDDPGYQGQVLIGRPLVNMQVYVLDRQLRLVPKGSVGELYIGGPQVARGYQNQVALTESRFIAHPFKAGERLYKSGDLVRWTEAGELAYMGRDDEQIKIRGFRIEPGEIEAVLNGLSQVNSSLVVAIQDMSNHTRLVGYIKTNEKEQFLPLQLEAELHDRLPAHMIPSRFIQVHTWPLTVNGKIDKRALPEPQFTSSDDYVAASTEQEQILVEIWSELLAVPVEQLSVTDNFFELGGDSILSIQAVSRAAQQGLHFSVKNLFEYQTIRALQGQLRTRTLIEHEQGEITGEQPLLPIQTHFFSDETELHHYNQAVLLQVPVGFKASWLEPLLVALCERHDVLRLRFEQSADGAWTGRYQPLTTMKWSEYVEVASLSPDTPEVFEARCTDIQRSLSLSGPLFKMGYFDGQQQSGRLLLTLHHLLVDGVSWRVLLEDLDTLCHQLEAAQPLSLAAKTMSYQRYGTVL